MIGVSAVLFDKLIGVTVSPVPPKLLAGPKFAVYAFVPSGVIAMPSGVTPVPTEIGDPTVPAGSAIGYTLFEPLSVTYAVLPSGVIAI